jgi:hypothetical protein
VNAETKFNIELHLAVFDQQVAVARLAEDDLRKIVLARVTVEDW